MKVYEIRMNRSRWINLLISILLIVMLVMLCTPYFTYGDDKKNLIPQNGNTAHLLLDTWELKGSDSTKDGYQEIVFNDAKSMTVRSTNIIRVNQNVADEAAQAVLKNFNDAAAQLEEANTTFQKATALHAQVNAAYAIANANRPPEVTDAATTSETAPAVTPADAATPSDAEKAPETVPIDMSAMDKDLRSATNAYNTAKTNYEEMLVQYEIASKAVVDAYAGAALTYTADAGYCWVLETSDAYNKAMNDILNNHISTADLSEINDITDDSSSADIKAIVDEKLKRSGLTGQEIEDLVIEKLNQEKAKASDGAKLASSALSASAAAIKSISSALKRVTTGLTNNEKSLKSMQSGIIAALPGYEFETPAEPVIAPLSVSKPNYVEYSPNTEEPVMMETKGTVAYRERKDRDTYELTLTFANGSKFVTSYSTELSYDEKKQISILGYIGFPYNAADFTNDMAYKINDFYINDIVLIPILLMIMAVVGIVMCFIKRDKLVSGVIPALAGILGIIGYLTSDFLKLGDNFAVHIALFAVILVISCIHILLHVKDKKKAA